MSRFFDLPEGKLDVGISSNKCFYYRNSYTTSCEEIVHSAHFAMVIYPVFIPNQQPIFSSSVPAYIASGANSYIWCFKKLLVLYIKAH